MNTLRENRVSTLICLLSFGDDAGDRSALQLAKLFGTSCRALLIEDRDLAQSPKLDQTSDRLVARRRRELTYLGREMGLTVSVDSSDLSPGMQQIRAQPDKAMMILMQPAHPLSRQTHTFQAIQAAAAAAPATTLYAPPLSGLKSGPILVLARRDDSPGLTLAKQIAKDTNRPLEVARLDLGPQPAITSLVAAVALQQIVDVPCLIIVSHDELMSAPSVYSSLAARLDTPVLVAGGESSHSSDPDTPGRVS